MLSTFSMTRMFEKIIVGTHHSRTDKHRLGRGLEGVAAPSLLLQVMQTLLPVGKEAEVELNGLVLVGQVFDSESSYTLCALAVSGP
jgi:hypothetical protein